MDETTKAIDKMIARLVNQVWGYVTSGKAWVTAGAMFVGYQQGGWEGLAIAAGAGGLFVGAKTVQNIKLAQSEATKEVARIDAEAEMVIESAKLKAPGPIHVPWAGLPEQPAPVPEFINNDWEPMDTKAFIKSLKIQKKGEPNPEWAVEEGFIVAMRSYDYSKHGTPYNRRVDDALRNWAEPLVELKKTAYQVLLGIEPPENIAIMNSFGGRTGYVAAVVHIIEQATGKCSTANDRIINQVRELYEAFEHLEGLQLLAERGVHWERLGHNGDNPWTLGELAPAVALPPSLTVENIDK